jgi:anti-anti-sigma factor
MHDDSRVPAPRAIAVDFHPADAPTFAAAVRLAGEHDLSTEADLRAALSPIYGDVLVDLSACAFIGSAVLRVVIADSQAREREGHRLELLVPTANRVITRTLEVSGVARLLRVRTEPGSGAQEAHEPA